MSIGSRILPAVRNVSEENLRIFSTFATPHISDNMNRLYATDSTIRPMHKNGVMTGNAFTVKTRPGDNLLIHKAIDLAGTGDVIVVEGSGDLTNALLGEIMVRLAKKNGIEGFVIDGAVRDSDAILEINYPVFAKGVTHRGPYKNGPGEINIPIQIGRTIIQPGDLVVGDMDGVISVPYTDVEDIKKKVQLTVEKEKQVFKSIDNGTIDRQWVDLKLQAPRTDSI